MQDNPGASRSYMIKRYPEIYKWLRENDVDWYEEYAPASRQYTPCDWPARDMQYLGKVTQAVAQILALPGRPVWVNRSSITKHSSLHNLYKALDKGYLPKTNAYLNETMESNEDWCKRKIRWAVRTLMNEGKSLSLGQIQVTAAISHKMFAPLKDFAYACVSQAVN
jgi:hypothetical protein